jgi:hypothetical protein
VAVPSEPYLPAPYQHTDADLHHRYIEALRDWAQHGGSPPPPVVREISFWI